MIPPERTACLTASVAALILAAPSLCAAASPAPTVPATAARVLAVIDGDTIDVEAAIWPQHVVRTRIRLDGINTPEIRGRCPSETAAALRAQKNLRGLLQGRQVLLTDVRPGKYAGRVVARVWIEGRDAARLMLLAGHGRPYSGGPRDGWCERQPD